MPDINYNDIVTDVVKQLHDKKTCYVTLNKTYNALKELLKINNADRENIVFIDGITKNVKNPPDVDDCYFIDSLTVTELSKNISALLKHDFDYLVFDSLTNLFAYQGKASVEYFIQTLVNILTEKNCKGVFFAVKESKSYDGYNPLMEIRQPSRSQEEKNLLLDRENMFTSRISDGMTIIDLGG